MKAAIVEAAGQNPIYGDFTQPVAADGKQLIHVTASALSPLTRGRASGRHYSSSGRFPLVAGVDGVGRLDDGRRVYFVMPEAPFGGMAERVAIDPTHCVFLPDELDDLTAAAIANPGISSWAAFEARANLRAGETVLINGATGISGRMAVQIARHKGAKKVIATGRNPEVLRSLEALGADVIIPLGEDSQALEEAFKREFAGGIDVVIDYLWGPSAERLLIAAAKASPDGQPVRFVQVGASSGQDITLPAAVLRSTAIELKGSGIGSVPFAKLVTSTQDLFSAAVAGGFKIELSPRPLAEVAEVWAEADGSKRTVLVP